MTFQPTRIPTSAGTSAGAMIPAALLSAALAGGDAVSYSGSSVAVKTRTGAREATARLDVPLEHGSRMTATLRQALCPVDGVARGSFRVSASYGETDWERRGEYVATVSDGRITAMTTSIRTRVELSGSSTPSFVTIGGTTRAALDGASGIYSVRSNIKPLQSADGTDFVGGRLVEAELDMSGSNMALMGAVLEDHWRVGLCR